MFLLAWYCLGFPSHHLVNVARHLMHALPVTILICDITFKMGKLGNCGPLPVQYTVQRDKEKKPNLQQKKNYGINR